MKRSEKDDKQGQNSPRIAFTAFDELLAIKDLVPSKHQRNVHPKEQIDRLAKIMMEHGIRHPIHVSKRSGQICFGHGRLAAAKKNKWKSFPVVYQDFSSDEEEYACVQSDNAIANWAELDLAKINEDLESLGPDFDIDLLGIKDFTLDPAEKFQPQCDEDEVPDKVEPKTKLGDIYQLGNHRLMCGDSTSIDAVEKLMNGENANLFLSDPSSGSTLIACEKTNRKCFMMEINPHYCDVIVARWEKYTGKKAALANGTT